MTTPSAQAALQALETVAANYFARTPGAQDALATLRQFIEGAELNRVDAERYRWLRDEAWGGHVANRRLPHVVEFKAGLMPGTVTELAEEALDTAIDAARSAEQKDTTAGHPGPASGDHPGPNSKG